MSQFHPSSYGDVSGAYGEADASAQQGQGAAAMEQYAPAISALLFGGDPREKHEKKKAALANYKSLYSRAPNKFLKNIYAMKIRSLKAEIRALEEIVGEERAAVALTQGGKLGGTFLLLAGGAAALMIANYFRQKAKTEKVQRRAILAASR